jgi:putative ABC transport system permease protein
MLRRKRSSGDFTAEIEAHLQLEIEELKQRGLSDEEAQDVAIRTFGNVTLAQERFYEADRWLWWDSLRQDIRFAVRMLRRNSGLTTLILLTLALGIGANTAIFSVVRGVLLRSFRYSNPKRLVVLSEHSPGLPLMYISLPNLRDWQAQNTVFESIEGFRSADMTLTGYGDPQALQTRQVSSNFFHMLGIEPILGRAFSKADDRANATRVVLLSDKFWANEFGSDPSVLHRQLILDGQPYLVVGVVPSSRCHTTWRRMDLFTPLGLMEDAIGRPAHRDLHQGLWAYARLKPGVTLQQARADMDKIALRLSQQYPSDQGQGTNVDPLMDNLVKDARAPLVLLMVAVTFVLTIACANVANLLLSRGIVRRREIAVRRVLGVSGLRLARQQLCESLLLALMGGVLGILLAYVGTAALTRLAQSTLPRMEEVSLDGSVLLFALLVSLLTGISFGVFPALMALRVDPNEVLKDTTYGSRHGLTRLGPRGFLVAGELALSLVLLVATGLSIKSLYNLAQVNLGFQPSNVLTASIRLADTKYPGDAARAEFIKKFMKSLASLQSVNVAGAIDPLNGGAQTDYHVEGRAVPVPGNEPYLELATATPGALATLGVRLVKGRYFNDSDNTDALAVIVDDKLAEEAWPGQDVLGKRLELDLGNTSAFKKARWTVVGVVHHLELYAGVVPTLPEAFVPMMQLCASHGSGAGSWCNPRGGIGLVFSSAERRSSLVPAIRDALYTLDPNLALSEVRSLTEITESYTASQQLLTTLLSILAGIALILAGVGTYGVMSYMVAGRTAEIGVRRALGAKQTHILRLVFNQGICISLAGLVLGILASFVLGRIIHPKLFGLAAADPLILGCVSGLLLTVALMASYVPAWKAMQLDPIEAVRHE